MRKSGNVANSNRRSQLSISCLICCHNSTSLSFHLHTHPATRVTSFIQVITTTPDRKLALAIAERLIETRLAACVQVGGPVTSTYRWQEKIETAEEWVCLGKCRADQFAEIERAIQQLHPYDVPEIIAVPILAGSDSYLSWLAAETAPTSNQPE